MKKKIWKIILAAINDEEFQIYIDSEGNALAKEEEDLVSRHSDKIRSLLMLADKRWDIDD